MHSGGRSMVANFGKILEKITVDRTDFEAAIAADGTGCSRLIFADWLESRGDDDEAEGLRRIRIAVGASFRRWRNLSGGYGGYGGSGGSAASGGSGGYGGYGG